MKMMSGVGLVLGVALAVGATGAAPARGAAAAPAQAPAEQAVPVFGVESSIVLLDIVVRDKKGRLVRDLTASDFEVLEDGQKQAVSSFRVLDNSPEPAAQAEPSSPATGVPSQAASAAPATAPAAAPAQRAPADSQPPVIAFLFDRLQTEARDNAHKAAMAYVTRGHVDGDVVGVFALDLALHTVQPFTKDLEKVRLAFDLAAARPATQFSTDVRQQERKFNDQAQRLEQQLSAMQSGGTDQTSTAAAAALAVEHTFALLQSGMMQSFDRLERDQQGFSTTNGLMALVSGLKAIPGRKTIVFFSEGLSITTQVVTAFRDVMAMANRANVTIYAIDSAGLRTTSQVAEARDELNDRMRQRTADLTRSDSNTRGALTQGQERSEDMLRANARAGLGQLAENTGGFLVVDTNDMARGFQQIQEEMRFHYLLSYSPTNQALDGSYRNLSVKVLRPGLVVHSRNGYRAVKPDATVPVRTFEAPAIAQLDKRPRPDDFPIGIAALSFPEPKRPGRLPVMVRVPGGNLQFDPDKDKKTYRAQLSIVARLRDAQGHEVDRLSRDYPLAVAADKVEAARKGEVLYFQETDLRPGRYTLEAAAWDDNAKKASVRTATVDVPAFTGTDLRLSSLMMLSRVEKLTPAEVAVDSPLHYGEMIVYPLMGQAIQKSLTPAIGFFFTVYGAPGAAAPKQAQVEIVRGGQTAAKLPLPLSAADANGRIQHAATLPTQALTPGDYTLRVTVSSGGQTATREAGFVIAE